MIKGTPLRTKIKHWAPEDRPREKLQLKGKSALSNAELIAILLGSGTPTQSALDIAKQMLLTVDNDLNRLAELSANDLMKFNGIGQARAIAVVATLELGRRRKEQTPNEKPKIISSRDAFELLKSDLTDIPHEEFWILLLNRANRVTKKHRISQGGVASTIADPKIIFKIALEEFATGIILAHNHPSGNLIASKTDVALTEKISQGAKLLDIQVLDHIIFAGKSYFSFADEGLL